MIGALGAMAPNRKRDITKIVVRAMIAGNVACFMTACIAGEYGRVVLYARLENKTSASCLALSVHLLALLEGILFLRVYRLGNAVESLALAICPPS